MKVIIGGLELNHSCLPYSYSYSYLYLHIDIYQKSWPDLILLLLRSDATASENQIPDKRHFPIALHLCALQTVFVAVPLLLVLESRDRLCVQHSSSTTLDTCPKSRRNPYTQDRRLALIRPCHFHDPMRLVLRKTQEKKRIRPSPSALGFSGMKKLERCRRDRPRLPRSTLR